MITGMPGELFRQRSLLHSYYRLPENYSLNCNLFLKYGVKSGGIQCDFVIFAV